MKKILLIAATMGIAASSNAQSRLALYEEFTGENCGPCASTNPDFDALVLTSANKSKIQLIKYQVNIPAGTTQLYPLAKVYADARQGYYDIRSAPSGKIDGMTSTPGHPTVPGHPGVFTQLEIDAAAAVTTPFTMAVTATWDATFTNIIAKIDVTAVGTYTGSGSVYLRTAVVQTVDYCFPPGNNGESSFTNVVRTMYPNATGTSVAANWAAGTTETYNFTIPVPNYADKSTSPYVVVWIQADGDKKIAQSAMSTPLPKVAVDLAQECSTPTTVCVTGTSGTVTHDVIVENKGASAVTSADIYYKLGTGAYTKYSWTGSIAAGATSSIVMPGVTLNAGATYQFRDSIVLSGDNNNINNVGGNSVAVLNSIPKTLPLTYGFETDFPLGYLDVDFDKKGGSWIRVYGTSAPIAHTGTYAAYFPLYAFERGASSYFVLPTPAIAPKTKLEFWEAYAQISTANNDKLEVVYSTNCGTSWTSLWTVAGSAHATRAPKSDNVYVPTPTEYVKRSIDISTMPANAILAIKATGDLGNTIFIDDINIAVGTAISELAQNIENVTIAPNPATSFANVSFSLNQKSQVNITIVDAVGKVVSTVVNEVMSSGTHRVNLDTQNLPSGIYMIKIASDDKTITERLSVVK